MTLQSLTYYVALVEAGSFTKAARACYVTQPALSRAIGELEREFKRTLLVRSAKGVQPTPAGRVCYEEAKKLLRQSRTMIQRIQGNSDDETGEIRIGYLYNSSISYLSEAIQDFAAIRPGVTFRTSYEDFKDARRMLKSGELDIALMSEATATALEGVRLQVIVEGGMYVVIPVGHPLYSEKSVHIEALRDERFIMWDPEELPGLSARTLEAFRNAGIEPNIAAYGKKLGDAVAFAIATGGIGVTTFAARRFNAEGVRVCPVVDVTVGFGIVMAMARNNYNPFAEEFFRHTGLIYN